MWSQVLFCILLSLAYANKSPGWKANTEYVYEVNGRTLSSLEISNQYSGLILKAKLHVNPKHDGVLQARLSEAQYAKIHAELPEGWQSIIPESEAKYQSLPISNKSFQMVIQDGVILDIVVEKNVQNWEANFIKSIASQFQIDTKGMNLIPSHINKLPEHGKNDAVFKTMEETITGNTETLYEIHPMPDYVWQNQPWLVPHPHLRGDGEVIEVVKHKNYSRSEDRPAYHYGFASMNNWEPSGNQLGQFFVRNAISRAVLTGNLNRYVIQNAYTVNDIILSPTLNDEQKSSVVSVLNVTLSSVNEKSEKPDEISHPQSLQSLVYSYNSPYESAGEARARKPYNARYYKDESSEEEDDSRSRLQYNLGRYRSYQKNWNNPRQSPSSEDYYQIQRMTPITKAPESPLLPYTVGNFGQSLKKGDINVGQNIERLAGEISKELQQTEQFIKEDGLYKFTLLTSLIRILDVEELKTIAEQVHSQQQNHEDKLKWVVLRDAVAQAGTGPAALTIQQWIESKKVQGEEAAQLVSTMAHTVRQPNEEFMKNFFEFVKKPEVQEEAYLNDTAILAYTNLLRKVYVNKDQSHGQFPVHSFGTFYTKNGREYLKNTVIPYLSEKLHLAIASADTHKTHIYIRALGNVAHKKILETYEPYLEGQKQASQFQRLMMIFSMDKLALSNPVVARSVLYKIYQNTGEGQEVRAAAVYQLMRTSPPTDILQRMASYTNIDHQEQVNAAVKSTIEAAAKLEGEEYQYLRSSAKAAKPLLTKKTYGIQHGYDFLRSYVIRELNTNYKQSIRAIGSQDAYIPKALKYSLRASFGGLKRHVANVEAAVSSVDDLFEVVSQQTEYYKQAKQQKQNNQQQKWSSENIAKLLNLQSDEREQLEGMMHFELGTFEQLLSFDNETVKQMPEAIRHLEESFKNGKSIHYTKIFNSREMAVAFPTETGFPFLFAYDTPTVLHIHGDVEAKATPPISRNQRLNQPEKVTSKFNGHVTFSTKVQSRVTFITPFDKQQYIAGFDKNMQVHLPVNGQAELNLQQGYAKAEFDLQEPHRDAPLFHYSTRPYTSRIDVTELKSIAQATNTQEIRKNNAREFDKVLSCPATGLSYRVQYQHEKQFIDFSKLKHAFGEHDVYYGLFSLWNDASIQQSILNVRFAPDQSTKKVVVQISAQSDFRAQPQRGDNGAELSINRLSQLPSDSKSRQDELKNSVGSDVNSAHLYSWDASLEFQGNNKHQYRLTGAYAHSNANPKSAFLAYFTKTSTNSKQLHAAIRIKSHLPNSESLDMKYELQQDLKGESKIEQVFGTDDETALRIQAQVDMWRSQERNQFLKNLAEYYECNSQMQKGNNQLPTCQNMTIRSNFIDRVDAKINYKNVHHQLARNVAGIYELMRVNYYSHLQEDFSQPGQQNQIDLKLMFHPDFRGINVTLKTQQGQSEFKDVELNQWVQEALVINPEYQWPSRVQGKIAGLHRYRETCVVDQTDANTFNNVTYSIESLDDKWTVMAQYVPRRSRHNSQHQRHQNEEGYLRDQIENFAILVRANQQDSHKKDVKIIVQTPQTQEKVVEISLTPSTGGKPAAKVQVNSQEVQLRDNDSHNIEGDTIQIYQVQNGVVKVLVQNNFYVLYDGSRVKITPLWFRWRDSTQGLCGTLNDDKADDFLTSHNAIASSSKDFIESYKINSDIQNSAQQQKNRIEKKSPLYVNVISNQDSGRDDQQEYSGSCTKFQTRYIEEDREICFTTRPVPVCSCTQRGSVERNVSVHCVPKNNAAQLWKEQIDKGLNPNFSSKYPTKTVQLQLPQECTP